MPAIRKEAMPIVYTPSRLLPGETELLRRHSFTRWMSRDLLQPASDFLKHLRLLAIYAECSPASEHRYLLWHPPEGCGFEIRSGRTREQFEAYDHANVERSWALLSLHINECDLHSAVWVSANHEETARKVLAAYGITPAVRTVSA
jgi:hypothetical protein